MTKTPKPRGGARPGAGRKPFQPTEEQRGFVLGAISSGLPRFEVAKRLKIDFKTLEKAFEYEIKNARAFADSNVAKTVYQRATGGGDWRKASDTAAIWYQKTICGMSDKITHAGSLEIVSKRQRDAAVAAAMKADE